MPPTPTTRRGARAATAWMPLTEVAEVLDISPRAVRARAAAGFFRGAKLWQGEWRIPRASVLAHLPAQRAGQFFCRQTLATALDVSVRTIMRLRAAGRLTGRHIPGIGWRVEAAEFSRYTAAIPGTE